MKMRRFGLGVAFALTCLSTLALARSPVSDAAEKLSELRQKRDTATAEWQEKLQAAKSQAEGQKIWEARPGKEFLADFKAIAIEAKGTDTAREAWLEVFSTAVESGIKDEVKPAIDVILADHVTSSGLASFAGALGGSSYVIGRADAIHSLETLIEKSPHAAVKAPALYSLGSLQLESDEPAEKAEGRKALERLIAEFPDVKPKRGGAYADRAKGQIFELDHLQVGMVAPNFESMDENGQKISVADYKGKVVVLDFWGNW